MRNLLRALQCGPRHKSLCLLSFALLLAGAWQPGAYSAPVTAAAKTAQKEFHPADIQLKNVHDAARRLRSSTLMLVNDVEQRNMVVTGEPEIIDPVPMKDDSHSIGWAQEMDDLGPALPPRKKWLDLDMSNTGQLLEVLQQDMDGVQFPAEKQTQLAGPWGQLKGLVQEAQTHYSNLQSLTKGPGFDNIKIGKEALAIYDNMGKMEKPLKEVLETLRSHG